MVVGSEITPSLWARLVAALRALRRAGATRLRTFLDRLGALKAVLLRRIPQRFHAITDEIAKFGTIGLINLGVNFAVFNALLLAARGSEVKAKIVATVVAATCAYFLNRYWTYRHRPKTTLRREYSLFFLFNAVGLIIEAAIVGLAKYGFDQTNVVVLNACTFVGIALGTVFRFWAYRTHVFKEAPSVAAASSATAPAVGAGPVLRADDPVAEAPETLDADVHPGLDGRATPDDQDVDDAEPVGQHLIDPDLESDLVEPTDIGESGVIVEPGIVVEPGVIVGQDLQAPAQDFDDLRDELVQLELAELLQAQQDDPVRR